MTASKRPIIIYVLVFAAALVLTGALLWLALTQFSQKPAMKDVYVPAKQSDLYTPEDHARFFQIGDQLQKGKPVSDDDVEYAITLLQNGPVKKTKEAQRAFQSYTVAQLVNHGSLTKPQQHQLAVALLPYTDDPPPDERAPAGDLQSVAVSQQSMAVLSLGSLTDPLAVQKMKQLSENSPTLKIRQEAGSRLKAQQKRAAKTRNKATSAK